MLSLVAHAPVVHRRAWERGLISVAGVNRRGNTNPRPLWRCSAHEGDDRRERSRRPSIDSMRVLLSVVFSLMSLICISLRDTANLEK